MSFDLTDRGMKLLYRQRCSHSRNVAEDGDDLLISTPSIEAPINEAIAYEETGNGSPAYEQADKGAAEYQPEDYEHELYEPSEHELFKDDAIDVIPVAGPAADAAEEPISYYNFQDMPLRQLSSSITSITSIDVLVSMFTNLFRNDLISQAMKDFEQTDDRRLKMLYKLDVRIFESIIEQLARDFQDILDINISNNELCYQLKQIMTVREDLNDELVSTRKELQELKCGGKLYQLQEESEKIDTRVELNERLNDLTAKVLGMTEINNPTPFPNIDDFCNDTNPYSGILAKIQTINENLQQHNE